MKVSLTSITIPQIKHEDVKSGEDLIIWTARVSSPNQMKHENGERLLKYLIKHGHWSPFELCTMGVEIETTVDIATQILRHRSFVFQQLSRRFSNEGVEFEWGECREQAITNKQSSHDLSQDDMRHPQWELLTKEIEQHCIYAYNKAVDNGIANEVARKLLPQSLMTRMYMTGSVRSWIHYLQLRLAKNTQKEHRAVALAIYDIFKEQYPVIATSAINAELIDAPLVNE